MSSTKAIPSILTRLAIMVGLGVFSAGVVLQIPGLSNVCKTIEDRVLYLMGGRADWNGVVIVDLGAERAGSTREPFRLDTELSRESLAATHAYLNRAGARAIVYDVASFDPDPADEKLSALVESNVVFAAVGMPLHPSAAGHDRSALAGVAIAGFKQGADLPPHREWADIRLPSPRLIRPGKALVGVINAEPDKDGITRRLPLLHAAHGAVLPSMPLAALMAADRVRPQINFSGTRVGIGVRSWNANEHGEVEPIFPRNIDEIPVIPFGRLAASAGSGRPDEAQDDAIRNRVVFVGGLNQDASPPITTLGGKISSVKFATVGYARLSTGSLLQPNSIFLDGAVLVLALLPGFWLLTRKSGASFDVIVVGIGAAVAIPAAAGLISSFADVRVFWPFALATGVLASALVVAWMKHAASEVRRHRNDERIATEESTRLKTQFLNHLTHELRTPLTAIMGFNKINQFTDELGKEQRVGNSAIIARNCEHLLALINNNLDLAKLEAGQLAISRQAEDPEPIFRDVLATMRALAADKKIDLRYVRRTPLPEALMLDSFRLRQVLLNLLGNAVKFTSRGSVELSVSWHVAALEIEVRDSGPGIPREAMDRIWQPFKQADLTVGRRFGGTGLGLAISRKLVELMGGEITVESQVGHGATFRVRVPTEAASRQASSESVAPAVVSRGRLSGHVLLADDNEDLRNLVTLLLRNLGLQVHGVENGLAAVETAVSDHFDVVLMDMEMPVMNGYEAVHVLRARGYTGTILGLTAHQEGIEVARAILAGCDAVLTKPVSVDSLKQAIAPVLERQAAHRASSDARREVLPQR